MNTQPKPMPSWQFRCLAILCVNSLTLEYNQQIERNQYELHV